MIFTLTDRMYNVLDAYETDDYLIGQYVGSILETLDINVLTKSIHADLWTRGNYIMCQDKSGRKYWFTIYDDEDGLNDDVKSFSCYSGTIDIVSEEYPPISATQAQPFEWYFNRIFSDTGITLGINEISGLSRKLEFTSENATNAEMLQFVLNGFDNAEAQLDVKFDGSTPTELILNVYKRIGEEQPQAILSDEDDSLTDLTRKGSLSELGTCLDLEGAEVDEKTITLAGKYYEEKDAAGNILYYSPKNLTRIFSVNAHEDYYVKLPNKANGEFDGYINRRYKSEAKTQDALWAEGLARLKKIDHAIVDYDAKGDINCGIGDNVQVVSHTMRPPVMVSARTTEYKFNDDDRSRNEYKFSNYVDLESNMDDLTSIINKIKDQIVYVVDQLVEYCLADQGDTAPVTGWTNVNPGAVKGKWLWVRTRLDYSNGTSSVSEVPTYSAINGDDGRGIAGTPETTYAKSANGTTPPTTGWTATRPDVPAGQYLWTKTTTKYTDDTESTTLIPTLMGPKGDPGAAGVGLKDKAVEYAKGTSGTVPPTTGWSETIPTVGANEYLWTRTTLEYTDDSSTVAYSIGKIGANGQDAQLLYLTATAENMVFNADDTPKTAQTITISAKLQNVTGTATFKAIPYIGNTAQSAITLGGSGNNRTLSSSQWTNKDWTLVAITATLGSLSDTLSVTKVKDGMPGEDGNDGLPAYVHNAWSNSPDGTVDFTTVYPGENLMTGGKEFIAENTNYTSNQFVAAGSFNLDVEKLNEERSLTVSAYISVKNSQRIQPTGAFRIGYEGTVSLSNGTTDYVGIWHNGIIGETFYGRVKSIYKLPDGVNATKLKSHGNLYHQQNGEYLEVSHLKIEYGNNLDPIYTPSPTDDPVGAYPKYMGTCSNHIETAPTEPSEYSWARIGTSPTGIIESDTIPTNPYPGMLWDNTGEIAGYQINTTYRWDGTEWKVHLFSADNIRADTFIGFVFQGVEFIGSRFVNEWTDSQAGNKGRMQIADGELTSDYWLAGSSDENNTAGGHFSISRDGILTSTWKNETVAQSRGYVLTDQFLEFFYNGRSDLNGSGRLTALQLTNVPWTDFEYSSGYTTAESAPCQYRVVYLLDGSKELQLRGRVKKTDGTAMPTNTSFPIATLPASARVSRTEIFPAADDTRKGARVALLTTGIVQLDAVNGSKYVSLGGIRVPLD
ncbi:hypothetical protein [Enterococcus asini]|uniref:hypothetical protein n=1 Tax=Enterococcus asini TaxID=57732 RepID=UPI0022E5A9C6|nr:hypothetical protein [Enterococcus asini]